MTLAELLVSSTIMVFVAGAMGTLAYTVQNTNKFSQGNAIAAQHARVVVQRMQRIMQQATASREFPGFAVFSESVGQYDFPDTLVVWHPESVALDPEGLPLFEELVVFCPNPDQPNQLWEIIVTNDNRQVPPLTDTSGWLSELAAIKKSTSNKKVTLSNLLRTPTTSGHKRRGAIRFERRLLPTDDELDNYDNGDLGWEELAWPQDFYGTETGLRQSWCSFELHVMPGESAFTSDPAGKTAIPFFGSAALYYEIKK
jgi:hypothetical protein